ncbi:FAD dependent oxidoreductase, partial [Aureobasidium melanogenum]
AAVFYNQGTFHPTKYLLGVLKWLSQQPNFSCYTRTRMLQCQEKGIEIMGFGSKEVKVTTEAGNTISCKDVVMATCVPLQKLSVVAEMEYDRTYCIAVRIPKGSYEDALIYDTAEAYKYIRFTECDEKDDYLVIGGCDHKVGQHGNEKENYEELERWTRERFTQVGTTDYKWSGQIFEPVDAVAFIGLDPGTKHTYIVTGDSGNGLTHGVMAGRIIADHITGQENAWAALYDPSRKASIVKSAKEMVTHDLQINSQYKRMLQSDINDIEDLLPGTGGVLNSKTSKPIAVYKTESGEVRKMSALCPHMKGVVCWNHAEASWDCPVHASRFSSDGVCVMGPAKGNLNPENEEAKRALQQAVQG